MDLPVVSMINVHGKLCLAAVPLLQGASPATTAVVGIGAAAPDGAVVAVTTLGGGPRSRGSVTRAVVSPVVRIGAAGYRKSGFHAG